MNLAGWANKKNECPFKLVDPLQAVRNQSARLQVKLTTSIEIKDLIDNVKQKKAK